MKDNKESINEIHELIEGIDKEENEKKEKSKEDYFNIVVLGLTIIQAGSIFYTMFHDLLGNSPLLFSIFLIINILIIIYIGFNVFKRLNPASKSNNLV
jgi:undecaprenyl pyrophosphate phosphatase UppP